MVCIPTSKFGTMHFTGPKVFGTWFYLFLFRVAHWRDLGRLNPGTQRGNLISQKFSILYKRPYFSKHVIFFLKDKRGFNNWACCLKVIRTQLIYFWAPCRYIVTYVRAMFTYRFFLASLLLRLKALSTNLYHLVLSTNLWSICQDTKSPHDLSMVSNRVR